MFTIDTNIWKQACFNDVRMICPLIVGGGVAALVSKVGHSFFKCEDGTNNTSKGIKLVSFVAGTAAGIYASSFFPLHVFTAKAAWDVACFTLPISIIASIVMLPIKKKIYMPGLEGALVGLGGQYGPAAFAVVGGVVGALLRPEKEPE
jgi:hypothetical protein